MRGSATPTARGNCRNNHSFHELARPYDEAIHIQISSLNPQDNMGVVTILSAEIRTLGTERVKN